VDARLYDKAYMLYGSTARLLSGKVATKDWQATAQAMWEWAKRQVEEMHRQTLDVPDFDGKPADPPAPVKADPPPTEPPAPEAPEPPKTEPPQEQVTYLSAEQQQIFVAHCKRQGLSEIGTQRFLKAHDIVGVAKVPLTQARELWEQVKEPDIIQQYR
jgi:type IV secretory pathway VirB10-like protein